MKKVDIKGSNFYSLFIDKYKPNTPFSDKRLQEILPYLTKFLRGKTVLDAGCGCGLFSFNLEKKGFIVTGIDFNKKYLNLARKYAKKTKSKTNFICKDLVKIDFIEKYQNIILLGNTLPHFTMEEFDLILQNLSKGLKKGGRFIIEYNDWVGLLLTHYPKEFIEGENPRVTSKHVDYSPEEGALFREFTARKKKFKLKLAVWSPYILDYIMNAHNFKNIYLGNVRGNKFVSVYEKK
jgi:2-polyprenyl-3-methyl-5-hydroxy-6-metoxy-1,4-benzoquinol methylase